MVFWWLVQKHVIATSTGDTHCQLITYFMSILFFLLYFPVFLLSQLFRSYFAFLWSVSKQLRISCIQCRCSTFFCLILFSPQKEHYISERRPQHYQSRIDRLSIWECVYDFLCVCESRQLQRFIVIVIVSEQLHLLICECIPTHFFQFSQHFPALLSLPV